MSSNNEELLFEEEVKMIRVIATNWQGILMAKKDCETELEVRGFYKQKMPGALERN